LNNETDPSGIGRYTGLKIKSQVPVYQPELVGSSPAFGTKFFQFVMFSIYAIKSIKHNFIYVGMTENLDERLVRHNKGYVKSTKRFAPFHLFYSENCEDGLEARKRERFLKSTSGKRFLKSILNNETESSKIGR
jgi:putative endonuclease